MTIYVCRTDNYDLTDRVEAALAADGHDWADFVPVVEGIDADLDRCRTSASFLEERWRRDLDNDETVQVTCPRDDTLNVFEIRRSS